MTNSVEPTITAWLAIQRARRDPAAIIKNLVATLSPKDPAWIAIANSDQVDAQITRLSELVASRSPNDLPLFGVPFAVKDNIDVAGWPTTAACPDFAYHATTTAFAVQRLLDAGAILVGKTNLDQFATGLVGTRSPYGVVPNSFDPRYIGGGSSSGSASVVARGLVPFALGTDTAGSGRVPAGLNNLVGLKPTRGLVSASGVVPACRSLDCVSVFATTVADAALVRDLLSGFDPGDPYARHSSPSPAACRPIAGLRVGVPREPQFFGDSEAEGCFARAAQAWQELGARIEQVDFGPLHELANLLYAGPWVAERLLATGKLLATRPEAIHPVVREIVAKGQSFSAVETFRAEYERLDLQRRAATIFETIDVLLVPTTPSIYTIDQVLADPIALNSQLGTYTNFVNLADWSALSLPAGFRGDGLPVGVTLIAPAWGDAFLANLGEQWESAQPWPLGATGQPAANPAGVPDYAVVQPGWVRLAVVGAHLRGLPLNYQITERQGIFRETTKTAAGYRLYALPGTVPPKPGLVRQPAGVAIEVELWDLPMTAYGSFVAGIPAPLGIGTIELADGRRVQGFLCEAAAVDGARDISDFGGWRAFIQSLP